MQLPAEGFICPAWPVIALLDAATAQEKLSIVHGQAEPAQADCACRLYTTGVAMQKLAMLKGELPDKPYGCAV